MKTFHSAANLFPLLEGEEYEALVDDIQENGQREPIWLHPDGSILDGRNRYRACEDLGITPQFRTWDGIGSPVAFVVSLNLHRRHLSSSQRAALACEILPMLEKEAKGRQGSREDITEKIPESEKGESREQAAKITGTNPRYVSDAKAIQEQAPEVFEEVKAGTINLSGARKLAKMPEETRSATLDKIRSGEEKDVQKALRSVVNEQMKDSPPLPNGKYKILYADPPWYYENSMPPGTTQPDEYYRLMKTPEICALPVRDLAEENAVLFLWTTSPHLPESFEVIKAWGFQYKSSFIWDKVKHNMGHYNSVRHEFLLVCVRGSCPPDNPKLFDSVQTIERTEHSVKPEEFRQIIDTIYPHGQRIELFARRPVEGWTVFGNEIST